MLLVIFKTNNFKKIKFYCLIYGIFSSGVLSSMEGSGPEDRVVGSYGRAQVPAPLDLTGISNFGTGVVAPGTGCSGGSDVVINFGAGVGQGKDGSTPVISAPYTGHGLGAANDPAERIVRAYTSGVARKRSVGVPGSYDPAGDVTAEPDGQNRALCMGLEIVKIMQERQEAEIAAQLARDMRAASEQGAKAKQAKIDWYWSCCYRACTAGIAAAALIVSLVQSQKSKTE